MGRRTDRRGERRRLTAATTTTAPPPTTAPPRIPLRTGRLRGARKWRWPHDDLPDRIREHLVGTLPPRGQPRVVATATGKPAVTSFPATLTAGPPGDMALGQSSGFVIGAYSESASQPGGWIGGESLLRCDRPSSLWAKPGTDTLGAHRPQLRARRFAVRSGSSGLTIEVVEHPVIGGQSRGSARQSPPALIRRHLTPGM